MPQRGGYQKLTPEQYLSPEWHELRKTGLGGSEVAAVLGLSPWSDAFELYHKKKNGWTTETTERMEMGLLMEPVIADLFTARTEIPTFEVGTWVGHDPHPWVIATLDRGIAGGIPLELKTTTSFDEWGDVGSDEIPKHYMCQVQQQMYVTGAPYAYVATLFNGNEFRWYKVERDNRFIALILEAGDEFMRRLREDDPPEMGSGQPSVRAFKKLHPDLVDEEYTVAQSLADRYLNARKAEAAAKETREDLEAQILQGMVNRRAAIAPDGTKLLSRSIYTRAGYTVLPTEVDQIRRALLK